MKILFAFSAAVILTLSLVGMIAYRKEISNLIPDFGAILAIIALVIIFTISIYKEL